MKKISIVFLTMLLVAMATVADETDFSRRYDESIRPHYDSGKFGSFVGTEGVAISYVKFENPNEKGALVIVSGKSGAHVRWAEFIYDIQDWGYSIYIMDHRGMGMSGRMLDDPEKTHIDKFDYYVDDLRVFLDTVVMEKSHENLFLYAHSMGAIVSLLYMAEYPAYFDAAAFNAPMLSIDTGGVPKIVASTLTGFLTAFGGGANYALGQGPWALVPFEENDLTHSEARYRRWEEFDIADHPEITPGGVTNRWVYQSLKYSRRARWNSRRITVPLLVFEAEEDVFVQSRGIDLLCKRSVDCRRIFYPESKHIIPIEVDSIRSDMLMQLKSFFAELSG